MFKLTALFISALALSTSVAAFDNKIYLIRHGEKPSDDDTPGLSSQGEDRAQSVALEPETRPEEIV